MREFQLEVSDSLMKAGKVLRKPARPSSSSEPTSSADANNLKHSVKPICKKRNLPESDVRYDNVGHWPNFVEQTLENKKKDMRRACKLCQEKTAVICDKCDIHLCLLKERNCFKKFHTLE